MKMKKKVGASTRTAIITVLAICMLLILVRQIFDFIGRLWIPIFVNFAYILFLIFGLFGIVQFRSSFLIVLLVWMPIWLAWNAFLICFYLNIGILNRNSKILSFGTRGAHSFWIERTPLCTNTYNLTEGIWISENCYLDYFYVEVIMAGVHIVFALIAVCYLLFFLITYGKKLHAGVAYGTLAGHQPRITVEFSDPGPKTTNFVSSNPNGRLTAVSNGPASQNPGYQSDSLYDASSTGYMNTSFESSPTSATNGFVPAICSKFVENSSRRHSRSSSKRRSKRKKSQEGLPRPNGAIYNRSSPSDEDRSVGDSVSQRRDSKQLENYSNADTAEMLDDIIRGPLRPRGRSHSATKTKRDERGRRKNRARSISPVPSSRNSNRIDETLESDSPLQPRNDQIRPYIRQRSSSTKQKQLKNRAQNNLSRYGGSHDQLMIGNRLADQVDFDNETNDMSIRKYNGSPRRLSVTEPRGIRNSTDSALNGPSMSTPQKRNSRNSQQIPAIMNQPLTSLISFDPKSNTLIRYHEHLARSRETVTNRTTDDSSSSNVLPPFPPEMHFQGNGHIPNGNVTSGLPSRANGHLPNGYPSNLNQQMNYYPIPPPLTNGGPPSDMVSYDSGHPPSSISTVGYSDIQQNGYVKPNPTYGIRTVPSRPVNGTTDLDPIYKPNFMKRPTQPPPGYPGSQTHYHQPMRPPQSQAPFPPPAQELTAHDRFLMAYQNGPLDDVNDTRESLPKSNGYLPSMGNSVNDFSASSASPVAFGSEPSFVFDQQDSPPGVPIINDKSLLV